MAITRDQVFDQLRTVEDPELHKDLVTLNMVKDVTVDGTRINVTIELTTPACPLKDQIRSAVEKALRQLGDEVEHIDVQLTANVQPSPQQKAAKDNPLPQVKHIIAVGAGKGGVGKSTIAVNLAVALGRSGAQVGLMDGDIYGPSLPTMLGLDNLSPRTTPDNLIVPFETHGIRSITIGKLVEPDKPLIWRGPMAHGAFRQLATQTDWGALDYLIVDLPPGTGDVPLTMSQLLPLCGAVVVCTPQKVAQDDVRRAINMFEQLSIPVLGIIENMSYFVGDDGKEYDIFGRGGALQMAQQMQIPVLGQVPINMALRANCDNGDPSANFTANDQLADALTELARNLAGRISIVSSDRQYQQPTISIT